MDTNLYDLSILLGYSHVEKIIAEGSIQNFDFFSSPLSPFAKYLPVLFLQLEKIKSQLPKIIYPSIYLIQLMKSESSKSGHCLICDRHLSQVRNHYRSIHCLNLNEVEAFYSIVGDLSVFYMPLEPDNPTISSKIKEPNNNLQNVPIEKKQEINDENIRGFYAVKNNNSNAIIFICVDCGQMMERNQTVKHRKNHSKNKVNEDAKK